MLKDAPMYSYIPAKDVARARAFYEEKLGFKPQDVSPGGVTYEFANGTACFLVSDAKRRHFPSESGLLAGPGHRKGSRGTDGARREVREVRPAHDRRKRHLNCGRG